MEAIGVVSLKVAKHASNVGVVLMATPSLRIY
jgi:hypothetical protein